MSTFKPSKSLSSTRRIESAQDGDTSTSGSDDDDGCLELELLRSVARRVLGVAALEDRMAVIEAFQARLERLFRMVLCEAHGPSGPCAGHEF